jgi:hypothetical protein
MILGKANNTDMHIGYLGRVSQIFAGKSTRAQRAATDRRELINEVR